MTPAALNTTTTKSGDHPEKKPDTIPATTTGCISSDNLSDSSTGQKYGQTMPNAKVSLTVTADDDNINNNGEDDSVTDTQRKICRAERFGLPVLLSEQEKRNSRAERFGIASGAQGLGTAKKAEELKRKARAERFGITQSTPAEEEEKKKARLSRFGSSSCADPIEEEKKKARALRFSGTPVTGNEKILPKATIAGKAGGEA